MARKMFEDMFEGTVLKEDIQRILGECNIQGLREFTEDDLTFIKEMIDVPRQLEQQGVYKLCSLKFMLIPVKIY
jgi:hypothetical protein